MSPIHVSVGNDAMPPSDSDIVIDIKYDDSMGASRVFGIASEIIKSFEDLDRVLITSINSEISTQFILEDLERSSVKIFLRNLLAEIDDTALKELDWKQQVGKYLVKAKYAAIRWLDQSAENSSIEDLTKTIHRLAEESDVLHLPSYPRINPYRIAQPLDSIQRVKAGMKNNEGLIITLDGSEYSVDINSTWSPSEIIPEDALEKELSNEIDLVLVIKKPDMLGGSKWAFKHGKNSLSASIEDEKWNEEFKSGKHPIAPGDALRVRVRYDYKYDKDGNLKDADETIVRVYGVIKPQDPTMGDLLNKDS